MEWLCRHCCLMAQLVGGWGNEVGFGMEFSKPYSQESNWAHNKSYFFRKKNWKFDPRGVEQCRDGASFSDAEKRALNEGCQIYGSLEVNRVGGSFHIAPGKSFSINHVHVHDVQPFSSTDFNVTHRIRHLSFGPKVDGQGNPLDGVVAVADKGAMMFQVIFDNFFLEIQPLCAFWKASCSSLHGLDSRSNFPFS